MYYASQNFKTFAEYASDTEMILYSVFGAVGAIGFIVFIILGIRLHYIRYDWEMCYDWKAKHSAIQELTRVRIMDPPRKGGYDFF